MRRPIRLGYVVTKLIELDGKPLPVASPGIVVVCFRDPVLGALQAQQGRLHGEEVVRFFFGQVVDEA